MQLIDGMREKRKYRKIKNKVQVTIVWEINDVRNWGLEYSELEAECFQIINLSLGRVVVIIMNVETNKYEYSDQKRHACKHARLIEVLFHFF